MTDRNGVARLLEIMARLRDPQRGCPWDLEQDFASIAPYTIEEAYEVDDAIRRGSLADLREELGDLLLQVVFHAQMAAESGAFDFASVVEALCQKLVARHPHVFGDAAVESADAQTEVWERLKSVERARKGSVSAADGLPMGLPALLRARKLLSRAERAGLAAEDGGDPAARIASAVAALRAPSPASEPDAGQRALGELLFAAVSLARSLGLDPEAALRERTARFESELRAAERRV
jgi:ATP diphosphatase